MNKRVFGSSLKSVMNLPQQSLILELRKQKEQKVHKKEKKEKKINRLKKQQKTILKKFKGVKNLKKGAKNKKEEKVFEDELSRLNSQYQNIFNQIQSLAYSHN